MVTNTSGNTLACIGCRFFLAFSIMAGAGLAPNGDHPVLAAGHVSCRSDTFVLVSGGR